MELITTGTVNAGQGNKQGRATVTIHDNLGNPVEDATVLGYFADPFDENVVTPIDGLTDANGMATLTTTGTARGNVNVSFCVAGASALDPVLIYEPNDNADPSYDCP